MSKKREPLLPWNDFPEGIIVRHEPNLWVVRTGVVVNRPRRAKRFEDSNVILTCLSGEANSVLGYTLEAKKDFPGVFESSSYMSLLGTRKPDAKHTKPKLVCKDPKVYLYKFSLSGAGRGAKSYWFLVRHKV